jgi:hypothetical protein
MQRWHIALCALIAGCSVGDEWKPSRPGEIFRYTAIGKSLPWDSIVLGQPWKSAAKYGAREGDTLTALPFGTFAGADAIGVHRDANGVVTQLEFVYHASRDLTALVNDYRAVLGPPVETVTDTLAGAVRTTMRWQNADTKFVIETLRPPQNDGVAAIALLSDRRQPQ